MDTMIHLDIPQEVAHITRLDVEGLRRELAIHLLINVYSLSAKPTSSHK